MDFCLILIANQLHKSYLLRNWLTFNFLTLKNIKLFSNQSTLGNFFFNLLYLQVLLLHSTFLTYFCTVLIQQSTSSTYRGKTKKKKVCLIGRCHHCRKILKYISKFSLDTNLLCIMLKEKLGKTASSANFIIAKVFLHIFLIIFTSNQPSLRNGGETLKLCLFQKYYCC